MRNEPVKVVLWGFGAMGQGLAKLLLEKEGFLIVGVCDHHSEHIGKDVFDVLKVDPYDHPPVDIRATIEEVIITEKCCDVVLMSTNTHTEDIIPQIEWLIRQRVNVITSAEEFVYLKSSKPEQATTIDQLAKEYGVTVLGTRITPGMMMDLLVIFITGTMQNIDKITVKRISSLSPFGTGTMESRGIGLTEDEFQEKMMQGEIVGHIGLKESSHMIADALGIEIDAYSEEIKPIITDVHRRSNFGEAQPGKVAGLHHASQAICDDGQMSVQLYHSQQFEPETAGVLTGDYIYLEGDTTINLAIRPGVDGSSGTIALCLNMIPHVINAKPGLKTMLDLPVPRAIIGDVRKLIEDRED